ncbi:hypothetical protein K1719_010200 [Acacia pycnantha]|nr:hypothetical protein K1719_010200 [Acacia pycnantha]
MVGEEEWRKNVSTHKMSAEEVKAVGVKASKRPLGSGHHPEGTFHQTKALPFSFTTITLTSLFISTAIRYFVLYAHKKPSSTASDVVKVSDICNT